MADNVFLPTSGAQLWDNAANWSLGAVPVTGDRAFIKSGDGTLVITTGSTQAAVLLAEYVAYDTFLGTLDVDFHATLERHGFPSGSTNGNSGSGKVIRSNGADAATVIVYTTGNSLRATSGIGALQWTGTHATGNKFYVYAGSVDIGTDLSAAVVNDLDVQGGTVNIGQNATTKNITQTAGTINHTGLSNSSGVVVLTGGKFNTFGATKFPTITVNAGTANLSHRAASGDSATTVIQNAGIVNLQGDPRAFQVGTSFTFNGGTLQLFGLSQITGVSLTVPVGKLTIAA